MSIESNSDWYLKSPQWCFKWVWDEKQYVHFCRYERCILMVELVNLYIKPTLCESQCLRICVMCVFQLYKASSTSPQQCPISFPKLRWNNIAKCRESAHISASCCKVNCPLFLTHPLCMLFLFLKIFFSITPSEMAPFTEQLLNHLFKALALPGSSENEYIMKGEPDFPLFSECSPVRPTPKLF